MTAGQRKEINNKIAQFVGLDLCFIKKCDRFYRENACGYTMCEHEAWRLPYDQARKYEYGLNNDAVPWCDKVIVSPCPAPDYCSDRNAIIALVEQLKGRDREHYCLELLRRTVWTGSYSLSNPPDEVDQWWSIASASAEACAKSFLAVVELPMHGNYPKWGWKGVTATK